MAKYLVVKNFGHFTQWWKIEANSEEDAWNNAERDGHLTLQNVYRTPTDLISKGYVNSIENKDNELIENELFYKWLREAVEKGMKVNEYYYEKLYGLPFHDVWDNKKVEEENDINEE